MVKFHQDGNVGLLISVKTGLVWPNSGSKCSFEFHMLTQFLWTINDSHSAMIFFVLEWHFPVLFLLTEIGQIPWPGEIDPHICILAQYVILWYVWSFFQFAYLQKYSILKKLQDFVWFNKQKTDPDHN